MRSGEWINRSDTELVIAALLGNLEAFGELAGRFRPAVSILVNDIVNSREATEDVVQDVFLLAFKSLPLLRDEESFASWLYAIARNRAIRYLQREKRMVRLSELDMFILRESKAFDMEPGRNPLIKYDINVFQCYL